MCWYRDVRPYLQYRARPLEDYQYGHGICNGYAASHNAPTNLNIIIAVIIVMEKSLFGSGSESEPLGDIRLRPPQYRTCF